ncbi:hypothetical protein M9H77_06958 [Catharanthus roseus]|uniref:Uncharacterized protein n=1 Tax=Catharanthus roseus TaxID=4058 RepID=A0ACC0BTT6_CATRO|nr:hypothetical protein M9H77_06958 [Catharanthus roseus]
MATSENWQLFVHNGRHNHKIAVYCHGHAQAARLTEEQLLLSNSCNRLSSSKSVMFHSAIYYDFSKNKTLVLQSVQKMGYTVFYRNGEDSNVLSDIVVAHPTSIAMLRTWPYVLIMDTAYKTNK